MSFDMLCDWLLRDPSNQVMIPTSHGGHLVVKTNVSSIVMKDLDTGGVTMTNGTIETVIPEEEQEQTKTEPQTIPSYPETNQGVIVMEEGEIEQGFKSFREKFFGNATEQRSWMSSIVEKMEKRTQYLKKANSILDDQNANLETFVKENLGK